ncbi:MAG TPA: GFA family protein [Novosphingobium sp.]|nr:GFA family protein [Novosphingobium sp.]
MELTGGCHCGAVRYAVSGDPQHVALCHCSDCRKSAGAPMVSWAAFAEDELTVTQGEPVTVNSSGAAMRSFCGICGSGLFYRNAEFLPGIVDIQSATFDDPDSLPPGAHIQTGERLKWMETAHELPAFERYPSQG